MSETQYYAVFLFPQAMEALGEAIKPYLREGPLGAHILCHRVDTGGPLFQMLIPGRNGRGEDIEFELMFPHAMVRLVMSMREESELGFT